MSNQHKRQRTDESHDKTYEDIEQELRESHEEKERLIQGYEEKMRKLLEKIEECNATKERVRTAMESKSKIKLNIGGTIFTTSTESLASAKDSMFACWFSEEFSPQPDDNGEYFIDRDPAVFPIILNHLRGIEVKAQIAELTSSQKEILKSDIDYYYIASLFDYYPELQHSTLGIEKRYTKIASGGNSIWIWDMATCAVIKTLNGHSDIKGLVELSNGNLISYCSKYVFVWDMFTGECMKLPDEATDICSVIGLSDNRIAICSKNKMIYVWAVSTRKCIKTIEIDTKEHLSNRIDVIQLDSGTIAGVKYGGVIYIWDVSTGTVINELRCNGSEFYSLTKLMGGVFASGSDDGTIYLWSDHSGECIKTLKGHTQCVQTIIVINDKKILSIEDDGDVRIWDISTGKCIKTANSEVYCYNNPVALSEDKIISFKDKRIVVWEVSTNNVRYLEGHLFWITKIMKIDDNTVASLAQDNTIRFWNISTGYCTKTLNHDSSVTCMVQLQ
jgi:WD40 repeat protein